jgi:hypothetical protein
MSTPWHCNNFTTSTSKTLFDSSPKVDSSLTFTVFEHNIISSPLRFSSRQIGIEDLSSYHKNPNTPEEIALRNFLNTSDSTVLHIGPAYLKKDKSFSDFQPVVTGTVKVNESLLQAVQREILEELGIALPLSAFSQDSTLSSYFYCNIGNSRQLSIAEISEIQQRVDSPDRPKSEKQKIRVSVFCDSDKTDLLLSRKRLLPSNSKPDTGGETIIFGTKASFLGVLDQRKPIQSSSFNSRSYQPSGFNPRPYQSSGFNPRPYQPSGFNPRPYQSSGFNSRPYQSSEFNSYSNPNGKRERKWDSNDSNQSEPAPRFG